MQDEIAGVLLTRQVDKGDTRSKRNDRIVGIAQASVLFAEVRELADLPSVLPQQVEDFFVNYQKVREVEVTPLGRKGPESARRILEAVAS